MGLWDQACEGPEAGRSLPPGRGPKHCPWGDVDVACPLSHGRPWRREACLVSLPPVVIPGLCGHHHLLDAQGAASYFHLEKHNLAFCNFPPWGWPLILEQQSWILGA